MTIDAWDWLHRTGANPPHEPTADPCTSAPARPFLYEGVFAHEYQHLLEYYEDPGETIWVNEGLSDWVMSYVGYVDRSLPVTQIGFDSHTQCFLGWLGVVTAANPLPTTGGPEHSLNLWGDQTDDEGEILCDYGAAATMMHLLADRFGPEFMGDFHRDDLHGFESLSSLLDHAGGPSVTTLIDTWSAMAALDGVLDDGADLRGGNAAASRSPRWTRPSTGTPTRRTVPPVPRRTAPTSSGSAMAMGGSCARSGSRGSRSPASTQLPALPLEWTVDSDPAVSPATPRCSPARATTSTDRSSDEVDVPAGSPLLTFDADWSLEEGFDYGYVQVSTDGGDSYETVACSDQVEGPLGSAFNGESDAFPPESCDLSAFAGQTRGDPVQDGDGRGRALRRVLDRRRGHRWHGVVRRIQPRRVAAHRPSSTRSTLRATRSGSSRTTPGDTTP